MGIMVDEGLLEWDAPVTDYWPEWGNNGKGHIKVVNVMRHEGCLPFLSKDINLEWATTENIKDNVIGKILEDETCFYYT